MNNLEESGAPGFSDWASNLGSILSSRGGEYGDSTEMLNMIAKRWKTTLGREITGGQVAICLLDLKIIRLINSPQHPDSSLDMGGYTYLYDKWVKDTAKKEKEDKCPVNAMETEGLSVKKTS